MIPSVYMLWEKLLGIKYDNVQTAKKVTKINLRITVKRYAHLHPLTKTPAKFQKDHAKTQGEVAFTRLDTFCDRQTHRYFNISMGETTIFSKSLTSEIKLSLDCQFSADKLEMNPRSF